jgi:hypothetical protein
VRPIPVFDLEGYRTADRFTVPDSGQNLNLIFFDAHAPAPPVTQLAPVELEIEKLEINRKTRRKTLEHADQTPAMRLAGGHKTKHSFGRLLFKSHRQDAKEPQDLSHRTWKKYGAPLNFKNLELE